MLPSLHDGLAPLMSPWSGTCLVRLQRGFGILCLWDTLLILYLYFVPLFLEGFPKLSSVKNVEAAPSRLSPDGKITALALQAPQRSPLPITPQDPCCQDRKHLCRTYEPQPRACEKENRVNLSQKHIKGMCT